MEIPLENTDVINTKYDEVIKTKFHE